MWDWDRILAEGLAFRFERHARMADRVRAWAVENLALFAEAAFASQTVTCVANTRKLDVGALNAHLRADIAVKTCEEMPSGFHARYNALGKRYRYTVYNAATRPAIGARMQRFAENVDGSVST